MHYLHKILVYIPDAEPNADEQSHDELLNCIRAFAEDLTESYYGQAFDWRETDSAGRWADSYPVNVLLASENVEVFLEELSCCRQTQRNDIETCLQALKETVGTELTQIVDGVWENNPKNGQFKGFSFMTSYYLHHLAKMLYGLYNSDSYFYNTHEHTARLYPDDIEAVKNAPENWALVLFDYHN